jgi:hypothetical protein
MPRHFSSATAEQVAAAVEAILVLTNAANPPDVPGVAGFVDLPETQARAALDLAVDLGMLSETGGTYSQASPLGSFLRTADETQKAAVLRVVLNAYEPFQRFQERLDSTGDALRAAQQTKALFDLDAHAGDVKDTLVSLGTYARALVALGGGRYQVSAPSPGYPLQNLVSAAQDSTGAEATIRQQLGPRAVSRVDSGEVVDPLAAALLRAAKGNGGPAVQDAANAVESFLTRYGSRAGTNVSNIAGINGKAQALEAAGNLPKKLLNVSKYLGHVRNAADHGIDSDVGAAWVIRPHTGVEYVSVACSFIASVVTFEDGTVLEI